MLRPGTHVLGPDTGSLVVRTYRDGVAARAGHDLVLEVQRWQATLDVGGDPAGSSVELRADASSLAVRDGLGGVKPLTDRDRRDILARIDAQVLRSQPIVFRSTSVRRDGDALEIAGELTMAGTSAAVTGRLAVDGDRLSGTIPVRQTAWGITPYRGLLGALKLRDEVEVVVDARVPAG